MSVRVEWSRIAARHVLSTRVWEASRCATIWCVLSAVLSSLRHFSPRNNPANQRSISFDFSQTEAGSPIRASTTPFPGARRMRGTCPHVSLARPKRGTSAEFPRNQRGTRSYFVRIAAAGSTRPRTTLRSTLVGFDTQQLLTEFGLDLDKEKSPTQDPRKQPGRTADETVDQECVAYPQTKPKSWPCNNSTPHCP